MVSVEVNWALSSKTIPQILCEIISISSVCAPHCGIAVQTMQHYACKGDSVEYD